MTRETDDPRFFTGQDLIDLGYAPAKWFGPALKTINEQQLSISRIHRLVQDLLPPPVIELHDAPIDYRLNITARGADEEANLAAVKRTFDLLARTPTIEAGAVMPDACPAGPDGTIPVGGVAAARNAIHPGMHSADICCSVQATVFEDASPIDVLNAMSSTTHFGPGGRAPAKQFELPREIDEAFAANQFLKDKRIRREARAHLGTQGDGFSYA